MSPIAYSQIEDLNENFLPGLTAIPDGASTRYWQGQKYQTTKQTLQDGKLVKLFAEGLADGDIISFNLYRLDAGDSLKPCEMPAEKVIDFTVNSTPD